MSVGQRIIRLLLVSGIWAALIAAAGFAAQMLIWWAAPDITVVSIGHAVAPQHAIQHSAYIFVLVLAGIFTLRAPEYIVRPLLFGEETPSSKPVLGPKR
ncbi:MAG TPA: hypothetical protein VMF30_13390 [Pirellulales bacterium]|nr:hypothetical protein [Pirellulales bacterium]